MAVTNREKYVTPTSVAQREGTRSHNHKLSLEALMTTDTQPEQPARETHRALKPEVSRRVV